jgi:hypothetical protein
MYMMYGVGREGVGKKKKKKKTNCWGSRHVKKKKL